MKTPFFGYRYGSYKVDSGYRMHEIQVYFLEKSGYSGKLYATDLFTVVCQSDEDSGFSFHKAYGLHIDRVSISRDMAYKALKAFSGINGFNSCHRAIVKALRKLKAVKIAYDNKSDSFLPKQYKHIPDMYFEALKDNLTVTAR